MTLLILCILVYLFLWLFSFKRFKVDFGVSFNQDHAQALGLDWRTVYQDMLTELKPKHVRIAAMWSDVEQKKGEYDFSNVDFMMNRALEHGATVTLVVGQKAPRWPECHVPEWLEYGADDSKQWLLKYVRKTVERYKNHKALDIWQVENEPFIRFEFGNCEKYRRDYVADEIALVRELDPNRRIMVTDSGELSTWRKASRTGDIFGSTLYRVVQTPRGMTVSYGWLPAGVYRLKSRLWGRGYDDFYVSELQAEPWFVDATPLDTPIEEQEKTMNPRRLQAHIDYVTRVGASRAYFWGVEWWYFMKQKYDDSRYWELAKTTIAKTTIGSESKTDD